MKNLITWFLLAVILSVISFIGIGQLVSCTNKKSKTEKRKEKPFVYISSVTCIRDSLGTRYNINYFISLNDDAFVPSKYKLEGVTKEEIDSIMALSN